ncbi:UNVERIFIED_CONTAM: hypothetical protein K2H54_005089 [Gekko kuhli]
MGFSSPADAVSAAPLDPPAGDSLQVSAPGGRGGSRAPARRTDLGPAAPRGRKGRPERRGRGKGALEAFFAILHWIQAVTAALSVTGSSSIIGYAVFQNTARSPEVRPLFYLSISDLCLGMCWLIGALLYSNTTTETPDQEVACYNVQTTGQGSQSPEPESQAALQAQL